MAFLCEKQDSRKIVKFVGGERNLVTHLAKEYSLFGEQLNFSFVSQNYQDYIAFMDKQKFIIEESVEIVFKKEESEVELQRFQKENHDIFESFQIVINEGHTLDLFNMQKPIQAAQKNGTEQNKVTEIGMKHLENQIPPPVSINSQTTQNHLEKLQMQVQFQKDVSKPPQKLPIITDRQRIDDVMRADGMKKESFEPVIITEEHQRKNSKKAIRCVQLKEIKNLNLSTESLVQSCSSSNVASVLLESEGKEKVLIGRGNAVDIKITDPMNSISSSHASLIFNTTKQIWCLVDEQSTNGTYIAIKNSLVKVGDSFLIGLHLFTVVKFEVQFPIKVTFSIENIVDSSKPTTNYQSTIDVGNPLKIGKKHQRFLEGDPFAEDEHCQFVFENKVKIKSIENVFYSVAKKLEPKKPVDLKEGSVFRCGFFSQFNFSSFIKYRNNNGNEGSDGCASCGQQASTFYALEPCNHVKICIKCASEDLCPICSESIKNFH